MPVNQLLASLPQEEYQRLVPYLEPVSLSLGQVLYEVGETIEYVYFLDGALVSLVSLLEDGSTTEVGIVGNDGVVGIPVFLGGHFTTNRAIVQMAGTAKRMDADSVKTEFNRGETMQRLLLLYTQALLTQVSQTAICNRHHPLEERLARWLLTAQDYAFSNSLQLTQEFISNMLGTRRSGVTVAASRLQQAGIIRYNRGRITILNREALATMACECYGVVKREFHRLFDLDLG
ncbi:MAG TPA: Crp/Fnr family transcriptional regulator [Cyanobacteria bacterium UBA8803]|nr:Crp/Fnr family transcriptional regulator [Cyanobacteria bacterium UBA9273]HBL61007.1 Crp/Fnr family transcriptional regulator [Cyanobacteria bacterium UBA8803]